MSNFILFDWFVCLIFFTAVGGRGRREERGIRVYKIKKKNRGVWSE